MEKEGEEMMECHSLQTVETLMRVGIGSRERMSWMRSELRFVISVISSSSDIASQKREEGNRRVIVSG